MTNLLFLLFLTFTVKTQAQVYTYSSTPTHTNGVPGDVMYFHIGFYNPSTSSITIQFDRYVKYNPSYWYSCFCFVQCNPPSLDYVDIDIPPMSWGPQMSIMFKTDSVNPGQATASIKFNQVGFAASADTIHLTATTTGTSTNIKTIAVKNKLSFPNPTKGEFTFISSENDPYHLVISDINGKVIYVQKDIMNQKHVIQLEDQPSGEYVLKALHTSGKTEIKKIIKN